ncbi:protein telomere ends associated-like isoform X2 [Drosophila pseudoobscura]|uniref:Protein telomere ends associated-like isoform X2 n=1 Tax=Drosophila pseudoobscura pseudoobscura TaxID=46245 RepID=A0A6I8W4K5_DROPS|nr:protein telomere ends associated isoform X2 [Drosophila pseudoobscura]
MPKSKQEARRHAVSFKEFSRLIENLPGIAEDVQRDFAGDGANKTLDECARWYYNAFYKDPSVRNRYKFKMRACAKLKKDKLLSLPEAEVDETSEESQHESVDDVEVKVDKMGMFVFPVTFGTFAKYADKDKICKLTTRKEKSTEEIESDSTQKRRQLQKFYNSFYMFPEERKCTNIFPEAPPELLLKLLQPGYPVDEETASRLAEHKKKGQSVQDLETHREPDTPEASRDFPIVSFQVFEKYLANLYDIVWQLKLNDPEYVAKGIDEGAYCYYLAFYLTPEIRDRYKYILRPCTSDLSARLLAIPSREEAEKLRRKLPELIKPSPDLERPKSPDLVTETAVPPVEFKFFKKYIVNLNDISQQMRGCDEYKDLSEEECVAEYFRQFYSAPEIRERFQYKLKPCPGMVRERLLGRPVCSDGPSNGAEKAAEQNRPAPMKDSSRQSDPEHLPEKEDCVENDNNNKNKCPVTFKEFKRCVSNLSEIVQKMQQSEEYRECSKEQCAEEYYRGFYSMPQMRERFECKFKPCPAKKCELLLRYAVEPLQPPEEQSENIPPQNTIFRKPDSLSSAPDDVVTIGTARFKFPVSLGVFRRCINYDEIVRSRLGKSTVKPQLQAQTANPQNPHYERYFRQFYVGFYAFPYFRKQHAYRFDCGGDEELLQKLCDYAVPLNESAKRKVDDEEKLRRPTGSRGRTEAAPTLMPKPALTEPCGVTPKISFEVFSKLLYLEDAVSKMLLHPNFAALTEDECQRLYYEAFYSTPSIRDKYPCRIKPCPAGLRANLLHIPPKPDNLSDHRHPQRNLSGQRQSTPDVDRLYADRKAELDGKQKLNVVNYVPHNLSSYIARRVACPERRAVVEKYIIETVSDLNEAAATSVSGLDTARRETGEEEKTEATPVAATIDVETTAATGREPAECPAASNEVEGEVENPEESRVKGDTVPESTTDSVPASNANNQCSTTLPEVEKTTNAGTTTSVTASNEVQTPASEVTVSSTEKTVHPAATAVTSSHLLEQLEQTVGIFAAPSHQEHTIKHLIFQSNGLKSTIWRILFQLSQEEFRTYTSFHNGEALYENEGGLQRCHQHVVDQGHWPFNLFVKLPMLRQLLHSKGVELQSLDLLQLSPKILHWSDLMLHTDFDEIVEQHYADRTGRQIDDTVLLFQEREQLYASCWTHDQWIRQVPKITNEALNEPIFGDAFDVAEHTKTAQTVQELETHREPDTPEAPEDISDFPIVSFQVFEKYLANLHDIVWQLKLNDSEYVAKGFDEGAYCYYLAFYLTPEIRDRYKYILRPCTSDLSARLLAIPSREEAEKLRRKLPELIKPSPDLERPKSPDLVTETAVPPVEFKFFKKYIVNLNDISQQMRGCDEYKDLSEEECVAEYFRQFYSAPEIRERFQYKLKPCPGMVRERLLGRPVCSDGPSNGAEKAAEQNRPAPMKDSSRQSDPEHLPEKEDCVENDNNNKNKCPVTFKEFKRCVSNLSEIVQKMQQSEEYRECSKEQCAEEYYRGFYSMPQMRERFECKFKPCPAKKCELLLRYAVEPLQPPEEQSENIPPQNTIFRKPDSLSSAPDDVVTIGTARFKFPVSLGVFRRCINYDEIVRSRLGKSTVKPQLQAQTANPQNPHYERYFRQFYVGFYAFPYFRKQHAYRFDCGGDEELLQKLCDYAVPLNESAKRKVDDEEKLRRPTGSRGRTEAAPTLMPKPALTEPCGVTPKISFEVFSKLLYLEDAVSKMLLHPNFAALTEDECQRLYYEAFYSTPSIRDKYPCRIKPCPAGLRANLLHIPPKPDNLSDHRHPQRNLSGQRQSTPDVDRLYADRKAELDGKQKLNVVNYVPHNLSSYIARRVACPERRAVVEKYIIETVRDLNEAAATSVSGLDTARRETGEEEKTEATPVAATIDVETTAATGREPAECPAACNEVEGEVENPEESRVKGDTVPESTTDSVPASNANNQCSTTLPEVEKTMNAGTTTSVTASNEVQTPASEVTVSSTEKTVHPAASAVTSSHLLEQLEQTVGIFAAPSHQEHTIKHLIFQSNGLKSTIWRILFQLSQEEFRTYTSFHNGEALYENEGVLQRCYQHVVDQGHWPFNLYVKLPMLRELLHSKGVELQSLDLLQLSPKILHWSDLMLHTDFDEIVEQHYADRTGRQIDDAVLLFQEREQLYASCWTHDQWIRQVPKITNEALNEPIFGDESAVADVELKRLCRMEESQATAMTIESDNTTPTPSEVSICLPTELNAQSFNFVDMDEVDPASQIPETQNNPLMESMQVPVKQEAIKFLDNMRGSYINSQEFMWESIDSKEQIINLDGSQESISGMACFTIRRATELASSSANAFPQFPESENHSNISTEPEIIETRPALIQAEEAVKPEPKSEPDPEPEPLPAPASIAMAQLNMMENEALVPPLNERLKPKHKMPDPNVVATKKPRLNEKVPQLRHEFRALPLHAVVRIESSDFVRGLEDEQPTTSLPVASEKETTITASQDFASGNTLLASSQLDVLLNAPNVTVRKRP